MKLFWLEEVTPAKPLSDLATINHAAKMPTAGGENIQGVAGFYPYIRAEAVDIVMPDVKYCGGILELKKIAALAEGAGLQNLASWTGEPGGQHGRRPCHRRAPNFNILEFSYGEVPWRAELVDPPEEHERRRAGAVGPAGPWPQAQRKDRRALRRDVKIGPHARNLGRLFDRAPLTRQRIGVARHKRGVRSCPQ